MSTHTTVRDEVLQPSSLRTYPIEFWPPTEPTLLPQRTRPATSGDVALVQAASSSISHDWKAFHKNTRALGLAEKVHFLLTREAINFNPRRQVRAELLWLDRIRAAVAADRRIELTYPLFCRTGNRLKQFDNIGPSAGEHASLFFFAHINGLVKEIYEPGILVRVICDAALYNSAFGIEEPTIRKYIRGLKDEIVRLGLADAVELHDYVELLANCSREFRAVKEKVHRRLREEVGGLLLGIDSSTLFESVKASMNTRDLGMSYEDERDVFSPAENRLNPYFAIVHGITSHAFREVVAIRQACAELDLFERLWPQQVRVSCHKGPKNGRWILGLRAFPEYYGESKILPYHGMPVISRNGLTPKLNVVPELFLRGRPDLVRIVNPDGDVYAYVGEDDRGPETEKTYVPRAAAPASATA